MIIDDVMTTQEAGQRWNISAASIKQVCLKRYPNKQFTADEHRKSGKSWLVTRQGMERLYGEMPRILYVYENRGSLGDKRIGVAHSYHEALDMVMKKHFEGSNLIGEYDRQTWDELDMSEEYPNFKWTDDVTTVWCADWINDPVVDPGVYNADTVPGFIYDLFNINFNIKDMTDYEIEDCDED